MNPSTLRSVYLFVTYLRDRSAPAWRRTVPALVVALTVVAGCGGEPGAGHQDQGQHGQQGQHGANQPGGTSPPPAKPSKFMTVQELATALGCDASVTAGSDFRQATCTGPDDNYVLVDFDTAAGQRAWLDGGLMYGGIYLTGDRWALTGKPMDYLQTLQATLGGKIEGDGTHK